MTTKPKRCRAKSEIWTEIGGERRRICLTCRKPKPQVDYRPHKSDCKTCERGKKRKSRSSRRDRERAKKREALAGRTPQSIRKEMQEAAVEIQSLLGYPAGGYTACTTQPTRTILKLHWSASVDLD